MDGKLASAELERYSRQIILPQIGEPGQQKLKQARVLVVGAGGLGSPVLLYLAAAGVGTLGIVDNDAVELSNLQRQILYREHQSGKLKTECVLHELQQLNSETELKTFDERLSVENVRKLFADFDLIVDGSDNFGTRYLVNDACVVMDKPCVAASIYKFEGQLSVFNAELPGGLRGPTYRCLYPAAPPADKMPSCGDIGVLGAVPGVLGTLQATEVLKLLLGIGDALIGRLLLVDLLSMKFRVMKFERDERCAGNTSILSAGEYDMLNRCAGGNTVREISPKQLRDRQAGGEEFFLLDVREQSERDEDHIGGLHIPLGSLEQQVDMIARDRTVVVYCRSGARSEKAVELLQQSYGFSDLYNLQGGMLRYRRECC